MIDSQQPSQRRPGSTYARTNGFTFLEVMIALGIVMALAFVAGHALVTLLGAEQQTHSAREAQLVLRSMSTGQFIGHSPSNSVKQASGAWVIRSERTNVEVDEDRTTSWNTWTLANAERPALSYRLSFRDKN